MSQGTPPAPPGDGNAPRPEAARFQRGFLLVMAAAISLLFLWMIRAFLIPVLLAAIFSGMALPLHRRLLRLVRGRQTLASAGVVLVVLLLILGPATAFLGLVASQALEVSQSVGPWVQQHLSNPAELQRVLAWIPFSDHLPFLHGVAPESGELVARLGKAVSRASSLLVDGLASLTRGTATFLLDVFILLYAMFFFLARGRELLDRILHYLPLEAEDERALIERFTSVTRATIKGSILIGAAQGALAGVAFAACGIPGAAFWGTIMAVLSIIPGIGAPLVWVPATLWLFAVGKTGAAVALAVWCAAVVGSIDNLLRPRLVGADARMPDLLILLGTLGGISLFGPVGFILGPIVAALFVAIWQLYGRTFAELLPPVAPR